jgi:hypothetical protein
MSNRRLAKGLRPVRSTLLAVISVGLLASSLGSAKFPLRDLDGNCEVDWYDMLILAEQWLKSGGVFQESHGLVVMEGEHYFSKTEGSGLLKGYRWQHLSSGSAVGENFMQVLPDAGNSIDSNLGSSSPMLSYVIDFHQRGSQTYYVWLKGMAKDRASDDLHYGLDGSAISGNWSDCLKLPTSGNFSWRSLRGDGSRPTLTVTSPGEHTLDLWMREDGAQIDRLLLTVDPDYTPDSPPESNTYPQLAGDLDGDYWVTTPDFALLAQQWLQIDSGDPNLMGHWRFDEALGNVAFDSSGNDHNGMIAKGAEWSATGRLGGALNFKGIGNVEIPIEVFSRIDGEITIALWQYGSESQPVQDSIFQTSRPGYATNLNIHLPSDNGEVIWDCPSADRTKYVAVSPNEYKGRWNHWVFTKNIRSGYAKIYLNGSLVKMAVGKTGPIIPQLGITQASIGSYCSGDGGFYGFYEGLVDDFRIYNRELTEAEIARSAAAGSAWNPSPADNAEYVPAYTVLSWSPGSADVASHDVYFSTNFNDANNANNSLMVGGVYKGNQALDANNYNPCSRPGLEAGETYYWRIDEVSYDKRMAPRKGKVWKFQVSLIPKKVYVFNMQYSSYSERSLMTSIMGVVARTSPEVYLVTDPLEAVDLSHNPKFWLDELQRKCPDVEAIWNNDPGWYLNKYKDHFSGYILYDSDNVNSAASLAGIHSAIVVDASTDSYARAVGLTMIQDVRGKTDDWVYANYGPQFNKDCLFNHNGLNLGHHLRDYAIFKKGFMCWEASEIYWANQNDHTQVFGQWVDEMQFFASCSRNSLLGVAADWLQCGSATSQWRFPIIKQRTHTSCNIRTIPGKHYVAFVMSDGDNIQWLTNCFYCSPWWGSYYRGNFTMNWDINPLLGEINSLAMNYYYETASTGEHKDFFVTASGPGVMYPSQYPDIDGFVEVNSQAMKSVDHNVFSAIDTSWDTAKIDAILDAPQVMGMMFKTFCCGYKGLNGLIHWHNGKPCVTVKYSLWDGHDTPEGIINALNSAPRDPLYNQGSYSLVNVHPWSGDPMSKVNYIAQNLDPSVEMVSLEELIIHLRNNFGTW